MKSCERTKSVRQQICIVAGTAVVACVIFAMGLHVAIPDFWGAIQTRAHYSHASRIVDFSQYRHVVPIGSPSARANRASTLTNSRATVVESLDERLLRMSIATESNIVIMDASGHILFEAYHATPSANAAMLTNSMSMAKSLVAILTGIAIENGAIHSVDQPIGELLVELEHSRRGDITVKNLLQMESGLEDQNSGFPLTHLQSMYFGGAPHARALAVESVETPGTSFQYNSVNTQILLLILERHLGLEFEGLLTKYIWEPLNLDPGFGWRAEPNGDAKAFCCVFGTARAWASIGRIMLGEGAANSVDRQIVAKSWIDQMLEPSRIGSRYGYHIRLGFLEDFNVPFANFDGTPQQYVFVFRTLGLVAVRVGNENAAFSGQEFATEVLRSFGK